MNILKSTDHISMELTNDESLPQMIYAVYEKIQYRLRMIASHNSLHIIITHPSVTEIITHFWNCHSNGVNIELVPSASMTNKAYVLTTHIEMNHVLIYPENIEEFCNALQYYFDGKPSPLIVRASWAQAILTVRNR